MKLPRPPDPSRDHARAEEGPGAPAGGGVEGGGASLSSVGARNLAKYLSRVALTVGLKLFLFLMTVVRIARNSLSMLGSERLPAVEKSCSQLACTIHREG